MTQKSAQILKGKFIVLDGPDGCGKSTQSQKLAGWANDSGVQTVNFRDPGTTAIGEQIRNILLDTKNTEMCTRTELLLYMAARAQLWHENIAPALKAGQCVILDRWLSSTCAYQGYAGGFGIEKIIKIATDALEKPWPDLTIILDLDLDAASKRLKTNLDRMEQKGQAYHRNVRQGFLELARTQPDIRVVNSADPIDTVHDNIKKIITEALG